MYAGFWRRLVAYLIDKGLLTGVNLVICVLFSEPLEYALPLGDLNAFVYFRYIFQLNNILVYILGILLPWLYFALFESLKGATPGKMLLRISVVDSYLERNLSFWRATLRYYGKFISGLTLYIGYLMVSFTEQRRALHDFFGKSLVIRS